MCAVVCRGARRLTVAVAAAVVIHLTPSTTATATPAATTTAAPTPATPAAGAAT